MKTSTSTLKAPLKTNIDLDTIHRNNPIPITASLVGRSIFFKPIAPHLKATIVDLTPNTLYEIHAINTKFHHIHNGMFDLVYIFDDKDAKMSITLNTPSVHLDKAGMWYLAPKKEQEEGVSTNEQS